MSWYLHKCIKPRFYQQYVQRTVCVCIGVKCHLTVKVMVVSHTSMCGCVSWLSHTSTGTCFLSKATDHFSHMHQRWEVKNWQEKSLPQLGMESITTRSRVRYATGRASNKWIYSHTYQVYCPLWQIALMCTIKLLLPCKVPCTKCVFCSKSRSKKPHSILIFFLKTGISINIQHRKQLHVHW